MMAYQDRELELDLLAASLRADAEDIATYMEALAAKLEEAVPGRVTVQRQRQGMLGPKLVRRVSIEGGGERLELEAAGPNRFQARRVKVSGGIVLSREELDFEPWTQALSRILATEAGRNRQTKQALERLLLG
jgi:hypothetical protein